MNPWRARLDRWFGGLARRSPLSPNQITLIALTLNLAAAALLAFAGQNPVLFLVAPLIIAAGGLLDAIDGLVARHRDMKTRLGDFVDHFSDRVSDLALFAGWSIGSGVQGWIALVTLSLIALTGYTGTQIEASFGSRSYAGPGRGEYVLIVFALPLITWTILASGASGSMLASLRIVDWLALALAAGSFYSVTGRLREAINESRSGKESR
ncbi:MAG: CDP-alcohol phosphatidyltransferase family protein [Acidobacteria bacterium]|nr:CDP-alcohol phosphatidyltransferase family protein [Acidobacteriota bacterium]